MRKYLSSPRIALGLILLITALIYIGSLRYEFTYDDNQQIVLNSAITSASHLPEYFTTHVWASISPDAAANYYRPIFLLWLLLNFKLFGLSPAGWHATTILIHLIATWLVFVLAKRLTSDHLISAIAAFLFGIHPVHIESVAWISGVTDPLMTVFLIAAFLMYLDRVQRLEPANRRAIFQRPFLLSLLFYTLALLTKETAVAFVPIVICYDLFAGRKDEHGSSSRWLTSLFVSVLPYVIVTGVYILVRTKVLGSFSHELNPLPVTTIALTIPGVIWFYINHLIFPLPLSAFYDLGYSSGGWSFWVPLTALIFVLCFYLSLAKRAPLLLFLLTWILLPIVPLLNLSLFKSGEIVHDRYLYLPSIGFCIIVSSAFAYVARNHARYKVPALALLSIIGTAWILETVIQLPQWKNDIALYSHGVAVAPNNNLALNNLGTVLKFAGQLDESVVLFKKILARDPNNWSGLYNLGHSYYQMGNLDEASNYLGKAISINPRKPDQYLFYGLTAMGKGDNETAESAFRTAISLRPTNSKYRFALGVLLRQRGDLTGAKQELSKSLELDNSLDPTVRPLLTQLEAQGKSGSK